MRVIIIIQQQQQHRCLNIQKDGNRRDTETERVHVLLVIQMSSLTDVIRDAIAAAALATVNAVDRISCEPKSAAAAVERNI